MQKSRQSRGELSNPTKTWGILLLLFLLLFFFPPALFLISFFLFLLSLFLFFSFYAHTQKKIIYDFFLKKEKLNKSAASAAVAPEWGSPPSAGQAQAATCNPTVASHGFWALQLSIKALECQGSDGEDEEDDDDDGDEELGSLQAGFVLLLRGLFWGGGDAQSGSDLLPPVGLEPPRR